jgi:hypothetical protein
MMGGDGKPYIGFLAFEKGEPVYKRGKKPGEGTTNPFEALGRWINPNAYKESDKKLEERKKRESEVNSLEYYKSRGMTESSIKAQMKSTGQNYTRASNDLNYRNNTAKIASSKSNKGSGITPPPPTKISVSTRNKNSNRKGQGGRRGSGSSPSVPSFNSSNSSTNRRRNANTYGIG